MLNIIEAMLIYMMNNIKDYKILMLNYAFKFKFKALGIIPS